MHAGIVGTLVTGVVVINSQFVEPLDAVWLKVCQTVFCCRLGSCAKASYLSARQNRSRMHALPWPETRCPCNRCCQIRWWCTSCTRASSRAWPPSSAEHLCCPLWRGMSCARTSQTRCRAWGTACPGAGRPLFLHLSRNRSRTSLSCCIGHVHQADLLLNAGMLTRQHACMP